MTRRRRKRILFGVLLIYAAGIAFLLYRVLADVDPRYRESAEESLVETSQLLARLVEQDLGPGGAIDTRRLPPLFEGLYASRFEARIFGQTKTRVDLRLYVVDAAGRVLFDSRGTHTGADFSQWRDVHLALRGHYGARTTQEIPGQPDSSVMHVAAPVRAGERIVGAVSVAKPVQSFGQYVETARRNTLMVGVASALVMLLAALTVSVWLVRPIGLIGDFARYARSQPRPGFTRLVRHGVALLREAFDEMRDALAGRDYVTDYVQTLTHELKSPLSAIRGAAELLQEPDLPPAERQRFLGHIAHETGRIQEVVDRMLELSVLEARRSLERSGPVAMRPLLEAAVAAAAAAGAGRQVGVQLAAAEPVVVEGDPFLLRRAIDNLLDNALDFSPAGGEVRVRTRVELRHLVIEVQDQGPGFPAYASEQLFEKFYSLARPHSGRKSTGLGLSFVRQIAALHGGRVSLENQAEGGALAALSLPRSAASN